jgi:hypothetical protein
MKLSDATKQAVETHDAVMLGKVVEQLRVQLGFDYERTYAYVHGLTGITPEAFEDMMYEADSPPDKAQEAAEAKAKSASETEATKEPGEPEEEQGSTRVLAGLAGDLVTAAGVALARSGGQKADGKDRGDGAGPEEKTDRDADIKDFERVLDNCQDEDHGRLVRLLTHARWYCDAYGVNFARCVEASERVYRNESEEYHVNLCEVTSGLVTAKVSAEWDSRTGAPAEGVGLSVRLYVDGKLHRTCSGNAADTLRRIEATPASVWADQHESGEYGRTCLKEVCRAAADLVEHLSDGKALGDFPKTIEQYANREAGQKVKERALERDRDEERDR